MLKLNDNTIYYIILKKEEITINPNELPLFTKNKKEETQKSYQLLIKITKKYLKTIPEIVFNEDGKPFFKNNELYFNYSHSKNYIALAIAKVNVGIDIEESRIINDNIANRYLNGLTTNEERLQCWVHKEAYSKLIGKGLKINFANLDINKINNNNYFIISNNKYYCAIYYEGYNYQLQELNIK